MLILVLLEGMLPSLFQIHLWTNTLAPVNTPALNKAWAVIDFRMATVGMAICQCLGGHDEPLVLQFGFPLRAFVLKTYI